MKRLIAIGTLVSGAFCVSSALASPVIDNLNSEHTPGFFTFAPNNIGWMYEPGMDYDLDGVFGVFRAIPNPAPATRDVTLTIYDEVGGSVLRTGTFSAGAAGGQLGLTFSALPVTAGEDYFVTFTDIQGLGLNIVDFAYASGPDSTYFTPDDPGDVDFTSGWYTGANFSSFNSVASSPGFSAPILRFTGVPEPTTVLLTAVAASCMAIRRRRRPAPR